MSNNQIETIQNPKEIWGPIMWKILHNLTINVQDQKDNWAKTQNRKAVKSLLETMPCLRCRNHSLKMLSSVPMSPTKEQLQKFVIDLHNDVNKQNDKQIFSYEEVVELYNSLTSDNIKEDLLE